MLARIGIVVLVGFIVLIEAAIVAVMRDESRKKSPFEKKQKELFHRWLILWAVVNTVILVVGYYIATGTILGIQL